MRWRADGLMAHTSENGRFTINRSPAEGYGEGPITYMLVERVGSQSRIVAVERDIPDTHDDRLAATRRLRDIAGDLDV